MCANFCNCPKKTLRREPSSRSRAVTRTFCAGIHAARRTARPWRLRRLAECDCGSPLRRMDSSESAELPFLRFVRRRLICPPRARIISPSEKCQHGKRDRDGEGNHCAKRYHDFLGKGDWITSAPHRPRRREAALWNKVRRNPNIRKVCCESALRRMTCSCKEWYKHYRNFGR